MFDRERQTRYFNNYLGANAYWQMLKESGLSRDEIREIAEFYVEQREEAIEFMGGYKVYDGIPIAWREPIMYLTALRLAVDKADAWEPKVYVGSEEDGEDVAGGAGGAGGAGEEVSHAPVRYE